MPLSSHDQMRLGRRYALCVGIGTYTNLRNRNLRFAVDDARAIAQRLEGPMPDSFGVTLLTEPIQTSKAALNEAVEHLLSAPNRQAEDLAVLYFSCHGDLSAPEDTFCLLSSDAAAHPDGGFEPATFIGISDLARWFSQARMRNIVLLLDVCHSGGAGVAVQHFTLNLSAGPNFFIIGGARQDQVTRQSSQLRNGVFTHCLLRAFEQPPLKEGWLTISQIHTFVSEEIGWFAKGHPIQIQGVSISVNPNLPLLRNPSYPELCPVPPIWTIPQPRNPFFTGQEGVLARLTTILQQEQKTALSHPQAIAGLGGIGKTQLALEYAYRHRQDYHAILWSLANTREALISTFMSIAVLLDLPEKDEQDQIVTVEAVKRWLAGRSKWLLILDNADELSIVEEFIPSAFQGHLLITTRAQVTGALARKIEVEVMSPETGALLLLRRAGLIASRASLDQASRDESALAQELTQELGGLPLALDQAGAYVEEMQCSLSEYLQLYRTHRAALLGKRGELSPAYPKSVATTWSLSFQKVEQKNPAAAELLRLCAFLSPDAIPEEVLTQGAPLLGAILEPVAADAFLLGRAVGVLHAYSLVKRDPEDKTLSVHRLVQAVLQDAMDEQSKKEWAQRAVLAVNAAFPEVVEHQTWPQCDRLLPHALLCAELIAQEQMTLPQAARLLDRTGVYLGARGRYAEAEPLLERALAINEQQLGPQHPLTANSLNNLAALYLEQGKYEQAEPLLERALAICEQQLGPQHPYTVNSLNNLAALYHEQGKYEQAEPLDQRVLAIREQQLGPQHPDMAQSLNNLALLYFAQGKYEQAEPLHQRTLAIQEQQLGPQHPDMARSLGSLAALYHKQGKYEQAEPLLERALAICEQQLGPQHPLTAQSLDNLAALYLEQGKYEQAEPLLERALAIQLGGKHPDMAQSLGNLAGLYLEQGKYEQAEPLFKRALAIMEKQLGPQHPSTAQSLNNLALLYSAQGKYEQAEPLHQRALAINEQQLGPQHPSTANSLGSLAALYLEQGKYEQAEPLLERALAICEQQLGPQHLDTARSLSQLVLLYLEQGKYEQAEPLLERALAICEQQLGPQHPDTARSLNSLAALYHDQGKYEQAEPLYQRALAINEQQLGPQHPETAQSLNSLAALYHDQGKYEQAEPLYQRVLAIQEQQLGPQHPETAQSLNNLALLYSAQGKYEQAEPLYQRALAIHEQQLGPQHLDTARSLSQLALLYSDQGKYEQAEPLFKRALAIMEKQLGGKHPDTAAIREELILIRDRKQKAKGQG